MILSEKYVNRLVEVFNKYLHASRRRLQLITSAQELPSPKARTLHQFGYNKIYSMTKAFGSDWFIKGFRNTNSMEPLIDEGHVGIFSPPVNKKNLVVGDIPLFLRRRDSNLAVLHRIIKIGTDSQGWYCITRGDNVVWPDGKLRYEDIYGLLRAIVY